MKKKIVFSGICLCVIFSSFMGIFFAVDSTATATLDDTRNAAPQISDTPQNAESMEVSSTMTNGLAPAVIKEETYKNFLDYTGSDVFYYADVVCDRIVGKADKPFFQIKLKQTKLQSHWWAGAPNFHSVKITVKSPSGKLFEYPFNDGAKTEGTDLSCVLFNNDILIEDGTYTVSASGKITAGSESAQNASFTFVYDSIPPTGNLIVANGGITNTSVMFAANEGTLYYKSSPYAIPEKADIYHSSNIIRYNATEANYYKLKLQDAAGNDTQYTFIIDKTAPVLSLSGVAKNGFTSGTVRATWSTEVGGITAQRVSSNDTLTVKYSYSTGGTFPTWATTPYTANTELTEAGNYLIQIADTAGNLTNYQFTIDKSAPKLSLSGVAENGFTNGVVRASWDTLANGITAQLSNSSDSLSVKYSYNTDETFPTYSANTFSDTTVLTAAGNYLLTIQDRAGNITKYYFTIDRTAPTLSLSGVADEGFTNGNVSASWSTTVGGITRQLSNNSDGLTVRYSYNTAATFPTSATTSYTASTELNKVGNYLIVISDKAGNSTSYKFTIDKSAPSLSLNGLSDGFTNGNVTASWSTTVDGVKGQLSNNSDGLTVRYSFDTGATFPTSVSTTYTPGDILSEVGNYYIIIQDISGNISHYNFTIDRSAPTLSLSGVSDGGITKTNVIANWSMSIDGVNGQLSNDSDHLTAKYSYIGGLEFPTSASRDYTNGNLSVEGNYLLIITDKSGNSTSYTFTIDKTAPNLVSTLKEYTNQYFRYEADDLHGVATVEFRLNGGNIGSNVGSGVTVEAVPENYGVWEIRSIDIVGNVSDWKKVNLLVRSDFGNLEDTRNEYKTAAWYTVTLSAKNFPTEVVGKYSFETYAAALAFAVQKEWNYRVVSLSNGTWSYTNIANSSVTQIYTKRAELDVAINKYATANVSSRTVLKANGGTYYSPTDENGVVRPDALTRQNLTLPDILSAYSDLSLMLINHNYIFRMPNEVLAGNTSSFVLSYLSDGITLQPGISKTFPYGNSIKSMLEQFDAWYQGYYLVTETDLCGNVEKYLVYLDLETPSIIAQAQAGDGTITTINFDAAYTIAHKDVMLYTGLKLDSIIDNMDEFAMLMIDGRGLSSAVYLDGDELPNLGYESGYYGKYTITIYDRSFNALSFTVTIAGAPPVIGNSSLTNDTRCRITISLSDANNAITSIRFFKVSYTGEFTPMYADDDGIVISPEMLEYSLRIGGKYVIIITDVFGREIQSEPLFYMKGLPSGTLSGVKQNGITNNTVTFQYENTNKILVYIFNNGQWVASDDKAVIEERSGYNYASITASEANSYQYKIFLYVATDMNLFVEYIFEIDAIPPVVEIITDEGSIDAETVTRFPFRVNWSEYGITAYYYNKSSPMGEIGKERYIKGQVLTDKGMYVFEIKDKAGNVITFSVTVDNSVNHTLDGSFMILSDGSYISKNYITLTVEEMTTKWECDSSNDFVPANGQKITIDGTYKFRIEDLYGNVLELTLIIDNLPPDPVIRTSDEELEKDGMTNKAFTVTCDEENVIITYSTDGKSYAAYDGRRIETEGKHYFKLVDRMGNATMFSIRVDKTVDYTVTGKYILVENGYVAQYITLTVNEEYSVFDAVSSNGVIVELGERINAEGVYTLTISDLAGNVAVVVITIDLTPPTPKIETEAGKTIQPNGKTNEAFTVACDEPGASLYLAVGSGYKTYEGELLSLSGKYTFRLLDAIDNEFIFTVEIDGGVSYDIGGKFTTDSRGRYVSNTWLSLTITEEFVSFVVTSDNGRTFMSGDKIIHEGIYSVTVIDHAGNVETIGLIIDLTPPEPVIRTTSGAELQKDGKTNEPFNVDCQEDIIFEFCLNGTSYELYNKSILFEPAIYYFRLTDFAGNELVFTVQLDNGVDITISGTYKIDEQGRYVSLSGLTITVNEEYLLFYVVSSNGIIFGDGEKILDEGVYTITVTDLAGNVLVLIFVIDKTSPTPSVTSESGKTILPNGKTNEAFTVNCFEQHASVYWSRRDADYVLYNGESIDTEGKYYFKLIDFIGNSTIFSVTVDKTVSYTLKGLYKVVADNVYATNAGVILTIDEPYSLFEFRTDDGQVIVLGEKIVREGRYIITIMDEVGNVVEISLHVDYTAPGITLDGVEPDGITGQNVAVSIDDFKTAYYQIYGSSERIALTGNTVFNLAGKYTVVAEDHAGNRSSVSFTIDGELSMTVSPTILSGQLITGSIEFKFNEKMSSSLLTQNGGEPIVFNGGKISDAGVYTLTVTDLYGNTATYEWTILPLAARDYAFAVPADYTVNVLKDGSVYMGAVVSNRIQLTDNGEYELTFNSGDVNYTITLTVDNAKPTVEITQEKNKVVISQPSKQNVTYELTLDGKAVNFEIGKALTAVGEYTLTVTDEYGNQNVYTFTLQYMNAFAIAIIVIAVIIAVGIAIVIIATRAKQGVR